MRKIGKLWLLISTVVLMLVSTGAYAETEFCWKETWGTGAATRIPELCGANDERNGLFCYDKCKAGYTSNRIAGCIQDCPSGATDDGLFCGWPSYKAAEYPLWDEGRCKSKHASVGCGKIGLLWVENCKPGYKHVVGFCEKKDIDCAGMGLMPGRVANSCAKKTYGRQAKQAGCPAGEEFDSGFCYKACGANADRVGPLCWGKCPAGWVQCGMGCAKTEAACSAAVTDQVVSVLDSALSIAAMVGTMGGSAAAKQAAKTGVKQSTHLFTKAAWKNVKNIGKDQAIKLVKDKAIGLGLQTPKNIEKGVQYIWDLGAIDDSTTMTEIEKQHARAKIALDAVGLLDPSGVTGIVSAYTRPVCKDIAAARPANVPPATQGGAIQHATGAELVTLAEEGVKFNQKLVASASAKVATLTAAVAVEKNPGERARLQNELAEAQANLKAAAAQLQQSQQMLEQAKKWQISSASPPKP